MQVKIEDVSMTYHRAPRMWELVCRQLDDSEQAKDRGEDTHHAEVELDSELWDG
jgi:hypothetical protein